MKSLQNLYYFEQFKVGDSQYDTARFILFTDLMNLTLVNDLNPTPYSYYSLFNLPDSLINLFTDVVNIMQINQSDWINLKK
jgi:hypothetical protein